MSHKQSILIIGSGLSGMTTAIALSLLGKFDITIVSPDADNLKQKSETIIGDPRTTAITPNSKEILDKLGLWPDIGPHCGVIREIFVVDNDDKDSALKFNGDNIGYMVDNRYIISALINKLNINLINSQITEIISNDNNICRLKLENGDIVSADLVIACDGKISKIGKMAGIDFVYKDYDQLAMVCLVKHKEQHNGTAYEKFYEQGPFAVLPMKDDNISGIVWSEKPDVAKHILSLPQNEQKMLMDAKMNNVYDEYQIETKLAAYPLSLVYAKQYFAGRILLIGDSLHAIHPIAGQGYNLILNDIYELSKLLDKHVNLGSDIGSKLVLEEFYNKRKKDNLLMIKITDGFDKIFSNSNPIISKSRKFGMKLIQNSSIIKDYILNYATGTNI